MIRLKDYINVDKKVLSGQPVFLGTRVPVESLFWHLEKGYSIEDFIKDFPTVSKQQAIAVVEIAGNIMSSQDISKVYAATAA